MADALLGLYPFDKLYIADLDAIQGKGDNQAVVEALRARHPGIELWLDAGANRPQQVETAVQLGTTCILASERQSSLEDYLQLQALAGSRSPLSLDYAESGWLGPAALEQHPECWPERLICMTLGQVGSYGGPDYARLRELRARLPQHRIYAAGGLRNAADLEQLAQHGVTGVLVASALHDGKLAVEELASWQ